MTSETPGSLKLTNSRRESTIYQATRFKDYKGLCKVVAEVGTRKVLFLGTFQVCMPTTSEVVKANYLLTVAGRHRHKINQSCSCKYC